MKGKVFILVGRFYTRELTHIMVLLFQLAVQLEEFDIIMHPVMQHLIKEKWNQFGKFGAIIAAGIHFTYIMIWTFLAIFIARDGNYYDGTDAYWRIPLELLGVLMTMYFILMVSQVNSFANKEVTQNKSRTYGVGFFYTITFSVKETFLY